MEAAYNFDQNFHKLGVPPSPQEQRAKAAPARQAVLAKRHQSRVKQAQQPIHAQRDFQRKCLLRRARRADERGDVSVLPKGRTALRVAGRKGNFKLALEWPIRRMIRWFFVINLTSASGWESATDELAWGLSN